MQTCPICEINLINGKPAESAMPCGINREDVGICPFETKEEQDANFKKFGYKLAGGTFTDFD